MSGDTSNDAVTEEQKNPETCCEYILYAWINAIGGSMFYLKHDWYDGRRPDLSAVKFAAAMKEMQEEIEPLVDATVRFGVETPARLEEGGPSPSY